MKRITIEKASDVDVEYWFEREEEEITQEDYEHIRELVLDGYTQGELVHEETRGWWKII